MQGDGQILQKAVSAMGTGEHLQSFYPVSGGDISRAYRLETNRSIYFAKINERVSSDFFQKEALGLQTLQKAGALVPQVFYVQDEPGVIIMEWIEGEKHLKAEEELGRRLALIHSEPNSYYGFETDNYIGKLPQPNGSYKEWISFLREQRLGYQMMLADRHGLLTRERKERLERLLDRLPQWVDESLCRPSLLHGDLWAGNWIAGQNGKPYLIDPAVFYGDREFEMAFTELFGGFSSRFYDAYREVLPLSPGYEERKPIYQLYYLLTHLNLFGESYGPSVDRILRRYV